jgi:GNAT superfamily N-acetyltransferase
MSLSERLDAVNTACELGAAASSNALARFFREAGQAAGRTIVSIDWRSVVRPVICEDAEAVAELSGELGYPVSSKCMRQRIAELNARTDHAVFVACSSEGTVVGWIDVSIALHLQAEPRAEIGGLIVSNHVRSRGIGRVLMTEAERWAADRGVDKILVRSRTAREDAHRFYEREGYKRIKTSVIFEKEIRRGLENPVATNGRR